MFRVYLAAKMGHLLAQYNPAMLHLSDAMNSAFVAKALVHTAFIFTWAIGGSTAVRSPGRCGSSLCRSACSTPFVRRSKSGRWHRPLCSEVQNSESLHRREGCTAALELLKRVAERGPWAALLQDAAEHWAVRPAWRLVACMCECLQLPRSSAVPLLREARWHVDRCTAHMTAMHVGLASGRIHYNGYQGLRSRRFLEQSMLLERSP